MKPQAYLLDLLHTLVYDQTGWALPDTMLRDVARLVPTDLQNRADQADAPQLLAAWFQRARSRVLGVVSQVQQADVMYA